MPSQASRTILLRAVALPNDLIGASDSVLRLLKARLDFLQELWIKKMLFLRGLTMLLYDKYSVFDVLRQQEWVDVEQKWRQSIRFVPKDNENVDQHEDHSWGIHIPSRLFPVGVLKALVLSQLFYPILSKSLTCTEPEWPPCVLADSRVACSTLHGEPLGTVCPPIEDLGLFCLLSPGLKIKQ